MTPSESLLERYFTDVAADSGKSSNAFGVLRQYYDHSGFADYRQSFAPAHQVIVDTQPYPARDTLSCTAVSTTYPTCISDAQIKSEVQRLITADRLPTAGKPPKLSAHTPIYFVVLPANVKFCMVLATQCTDTNLNAYHLSFLTHGDAVLYAAIAMDPLQGVALPAPISGACDPGGTGVAQEPNNDPGDCAINSISHEDSEAITDPIGTGWDIAVTHWETGDACAHVGAFDPTHTTNPNAFLPTLGGSASGGTLYTQVINGDRYYTQSEWSNGDGNCEMRPTAGRTVPRFDVRGQTIAGMPVFFDAAAGRTMETLSSATWSFGDRSKPVFFYGHHTLERVEHRYRKGGRYTVTLTLVDSRGNLHTATQHVTIHSRQRVASATG